MHIQTNVLYSFFFRETMKRKNKHLGCVHTTGALIKKKLNVYLRRLIDQQCLIDHYGI